MKVTILGFLIVGLLFQRTTFFRSTFAVIHTLIHEVCHGFMALFLDGHTEKISLEMDASGSAWTGVRGRFRKMMVSYAGYTGSSIMTLICFFFLWNGLETTILCAFIGLVLFSAFCWIRNLYGFLWSVGLIGVVAACLYYQVDWFFSYGAYVISVVLLIEQHYCAHIILKLSFRTPERAGDATNLRLATGISARFWGVLFYIQATVVSLWVLYKTFFN